MLIEMGNPPVRGRRLLPPLIVLLAVLGIAGSASAATGALGQVQSTVQSVVTDPPGTVNNVIDQAQGVIDQTQSALGPMQGPTQGPVDQAQSTVNNAAGNPSGSTPSGGSGPTSPARNNPTGGSPSRTPRATGGSPTTSSHGQRATGRNGGGSATVSRASRRAGVVSIAAGAAALAARQVTDAKPVANTTKSTSDGPAEPISQAVTKFVKVVPGPIKIVIGVLAALAALFGLRSWLHGRRARRLERQREELLGDVGLLQRALLPDVPGRIGPLATSVAYRPADGPAAGGDFYDVFEIASGKIAVIVGDVCGHGRQALAQTALIRYTLRAYIDAGLGPRAALQVAGRALANDLAGELTTVVVAVYDASDSTLTYACAGHEPPILLGLPAHEPVVAGAAPPVGAGVETGMRETRVPLPAGASASFFTDGLVEARIDGGMVGRQRLTRMITELGDEQDARTLLARIHEDAQRAPDDMAACIIRAVEGPPTVTARVEELEVRNGEDWVRHAKGFLLACGVDASRAEELITSARVQAAEFGAAVLRVTIEGERTRGEVAPRPDAGQMVVLPPIQPGDASSLAF